MLIIQNFFNLYFFKKNKIIFIYKIVLFIYIIFYNLKYNELLNNSIINIKLWKYIYILNNNNNSILLILLIYFFILNLKKINFKKNIILLLSVTLLFSLKNINIDLISISSSVCDIGLININLINGVLLVHPFIMYYCYVLFLIITYNYVYNLKKKNFNIIFIKENIDILLKTSFISLFLGSY
jgi:hypothetical protein